MSFSRSLLTCSNFSASPASLARRFSISSGSARGADSASASCARSVSISVRASFNALFAAESSSMSFSRSLLTCSNFSASAASLLSLDKLSSRKRSISSCIRYEVCDARRFASSKSFLLLADSTSIARFISSKDSSTFDFCTVKASYFSRISDISASASRRACSISFCFAANSVSKRFFSFSYSSVVLRVRDSTSSRARRAVASASIKRSISCC